MHIELAAWPWPDDDGSGGGSTAPLGADCSRLAPADPSSFCGRESTISLPETERRAENDAASPRQVAVPTILATAALAMAALP